MMNMPKLTKTTKKSFFLINLLILSIFILALTMVFAGCRDSGKKSEQEDLVVSEDDLSFVIHENLVNKMNEEGYDSLTIYSHKVRT